MNASTVLCAALLVAALAIGACRKSEPDPDPLPDPQAAASEPQQL